MMRIYSWNDCPNIDLRDDRVVWWNNERICLKVKR